MEREPRRETINERLKQEILVMVQADREMRMGMKWDQNVDEPNTKRMKEIIKEYGWPGKTLVGKEGAAGAWLLVQHADHDVEFQREALKLLREAIENGEAEKRHEPYLIDRVRVNSGEPQLYGTQFYVDDNGDFVPRPIDNVEELALRREEYGLELFTEYKKSLTEMREASENS